MRLGKQKIMKRLHFMKQGHEMLWLLRKCFPASELPLSYNAHSSDAHAQLIGYEINLLNKV